MNEIQDRLAELEGLVAGPVGQTVGQYLPRALLAILVFFGGFLAIRFLIRGMAIAMEKRQMDNSLRPFLLSLTGIALKLALIVSVAGMLGVETTSFIAILGAAGLAIGLSLQGSLANFAGGVLILMFRPFKVGDFISAQGFDGTVSEIQVLFTVLKTPDNRRIILPNGQLANGAVVNVTAEPKRRVDFTFGIGYGDDIKKAKEILSEIANGDERVHREPAPMVMVGELGESSVNLRLRVWTDSSNYWPLFFEFTEKVKLTFDERGINIPFPQRDLHIVSNVESKKLAKTG